MLEFVAAAAATAANKVPGLMFEWAARTSL